MHNGGLKTPLAGRDFIAFFAVGISAYLFHLSFLKAAPAILNSDFAYFWLASDRIRSGHWVPFTFFGGTLVPALRALWQAIWVAVSGPETDASHLASAVAFTYAFLPAVLSAAVFALCRSLTGLLPSLLAGVIAAVGFHFNTLELFGTDYHSGAVILGCVLLSLRGQATHPLRDLPRARLVAAAFVTGLAVWVSRASLIYALAFWIPWQYAWAELTLALRPRNRGLRLVSLLFWILIGIWIYLEIFGPDLGSFRGHRVALDAGPNWDLAKLCLLILLGSSILPRVTRSDWVRVGWVAFGAALGFMPELWQRLVVEHKLPSLQSGYTLSFAESLVAIGKLPSSFRTIVAGDPLALSSTASVILAMAGLIALAQACRRKDWRFAPIGVVAVTAAIAYVRVRTYTTDAPVRYLLPILPAVFVGYACLGQKIAALVTPRLWVRGLALAALIGLTAAHAVGQISARDQATGQLIASGKFDQIQEVIRRFRENGVELVFTDSYWRTHPFGYVAREKPFFVYRDIWVPHWEEDDAVSNARKFGYLSASPLVSESETIRGHHYAVQALGKVGELYLSRLLRKDPE